MSMSNQNQGGAGRASHERRRLWMENDFSWFAQLAVVLSVGMAGCGARERHTGAKGSVEIIVPLNAEETTDVEVTISGDEHPQTVKMPKNDGAYRVNVLELSEGSHHFSVNAKDAAGKVIYAGETTSTVVGGQVTKVNIWLSPVPAPIVHGNVAPRVQGLSVTPSQVHPGDLVTLSVDAIDDKPAPLKFVWTTDQGTLGATDSASVPWRAPETTGEAHLGVDVEDSDHETTQIRFTVPVTKPTGGASIIAIINQAPTMTGLVAPGRLDRGVRVQLEVQGLADPDGDPLLPVDFRSSCQGDLASTGQTTADFTLTTLPADGTCTFTATAADNHGAKSMTRLAVAAGPSVAPPLPPEVLSAVGAGAVAPGETGTFAVSVREPGSGDPSALAVAWSLKAPTPSSGELRRPEEGVVGAELSSKVVYTAPASCYGGYRAMTVLARITGAGGVTERELPFMLHCASASDPGFAPTGTDVVTRPEGGAGVVVKFASVSEAGLVRATAITDPLAGLPGFQSVPGAFFDISFDGKTAGPITISMPYDPAALPTPSAVLLLHKAADGWQNISTSNDLEDHVVTGVATSLSPFVLATPAATNPSTSYTGCVLGCDVTRGACEVQGGGLLCGLVYDRCVADCEELYPIGGLPGQVLNFGQVKVGGSQTIVFGRESPIGGGILGNSTKGWRISFDPAPSVSGISRGDWSLPYGNSFELKLNEHQNVAVQFSPTQVGRQILTLYSWHVDRGQPVFGEEWTLVGVGVAP